MDEITVKTWFMEPTRLYGNREYLVTDRRGNTLLTGETEWLVATEGLEKLVSVKDYVKDGFYKKDGRLFGDRMKKIDKSFKEEQLLGVYRVSAADIDFVGHMNNAAYSRVIMSFVPSKEIDERKIKEAELFYALQCKEGDEISVYRRDAGKGAEFGAFIPDGRNVLTARLTYER